jgi:hypothetical protein
LPDGIFLNQNKKFGKIMEGLEMEKFGILSGQFGSYYFHLLYFKAVGNLVAVWYLFPRFGILCQEQIWQPWSSNLLTVPLPRMPSSYPFNMDISLIFL